MTTGEAIYLALILAAFLVYSVILFWAMVTSSGPPNTGDDQHPTAH
jgi:heme A synthase